MACLETIQASVMKIEAAVQSGQIDATMVADELYAIERTVRTARYTVRGLKKP